MIFLRFSRQLFCCIFCKLTIPKTIQQYVLGAMGVEFDKLRRKWYRCWFRSLSNIQINMWSSCCVLPSGFPLSSSVVHIVSVNFCVQCLYSFCTSTLHLFFLSSQAIVFEGHVYFKLMFINFYPQFSNDCFRINILLSIQFILCYHNFF